MATWISNAILSVADQDRSIDFYVGKLGWELRTDAEMWPGARWVEVGPAGSQAGVTLAKAGDFNKEPGGEAGFTMATDGVRALYAELGSRGDPVGPAGGRRGDPRPHQPPGQRPRQGRNMTNAEFPGPTPQLTVADAAAAIRWYTEVFGADELVRTPGPGGRVLHCELLIFGGRLLLHDQFPELGVADPTPADLGGSPVMLHLYVPDADALYATAIAAGAQGLMPPDDAFWGDR